MSFSEQLTNGKFEPLEWPKNWTLSYGTVTQLPLDWVGYDLRDNGAIVQLHCRSRADSDTALFEFTVDPDPAIGKIDEARSDALVGHDEVYLVLRVIVPGVSGAIDRSYAVVQGYVPVKPYTGADYPVMITPIALSELRQAIDDFNNLDQTTLDNVQSGLPSIIQVAGNLNNVNAVAGIESEIQAIAPVAGDVSTLAGLDDEIQELGAINQGLAELANQSSTIDQLGDYLQNQSLLASRYVNYRIYGEASTNSVTVSFSSLTLTPITGVATTNATHLNEQLTIDPSNYTTTSFLLAGSLNGAYWAEIVVYRMSSGDLRVGFLRQGDTFSHPAGATHFVKHGVIKMNYSSGGISISRDVVFQNNKVGLSSVSVADLSVLDGGLVPLSFNNLPTNAVGAELRLTLDTTGSVEGDLVSSFRFDNRTYERQKKFEAGNETGSLLPAVMHADLDINYKSQHQIAVNFESTGTPNSQKNLNVSIVSIRLAEPVQSQDITTTQQLRDTLANALLQGTHTNVTVTYDAQSGNISLSSPAAGETAFKDASFGDGTNGYTELTGAVDGTNTTFTVSRGEYMPGTIRVTADSLNYFPLAGIVETDPANGIFTLDIAPTYNVIAEYT